MPEYQKGQTAAYADVSEVLERYIRVWGETVALDLIRDYLQKAQAICIETAGRIEKIKADSEVAA